MIVNIFTNCHVLQSILATLLPKAISYLNLLLKILLLGNTLKTSLLKINHLKILNLYVFNKITLLIFFDEIFCVELVCFLL